MENEMFGAIKSLVSGKVNKFKGNKDFLEAVCAAAALVAYAPGPNGEPGSCDDKEAAAAIKAITSNAILSGSFSGREIETTMDSMLKRAEGGRVGKSGLLREVEETLIKDTTGDMSEAVLLTALDVADSDGISPQEEIVLEQIASKLKLKLADYK
jgi:tellurite resistance protein